MEAKNVACAISCFLSQESANLNKFSGCPGRNRTCGRHPDFHAKIDSNFKIIRRSSAVYARSMANLR